MPAMTALVESLENKRTIAQIEFIAGDGPVALILRHLEALSDADLEKLRAFARESGFAIFLQPGGPDSVRPLWPEQVELQFAIPEFDLTLAFRPLDFIQVNAGLNQQDDRACTRVARPAAAASACSTCSAAWVTSPCRWRGARAAWSAWRATPG